jgi:hypothetical protein
MVGSLSCRLTGCLSRWLAVCVALLTGVLADFTGSCSGWLVACMGSLAGFDAWISMLAGWICCFDGFAGWLQLLLGRLC